MIHKSGFSLITFILYLMLFSIIIACLFHVFSSLILPSLVATRRHNNRIALHIIIDNFVHDIRAARNYGICACKNIAPHEIIFNDTEKDIGWNFSKTTLKRIEGIYKDKWTKKRTSIVATNLKSVTFFGEYDENGLVGVECILAPLDEKISLVKGYVALR